MSSPVVFILYTNEFRSSQPNNCIIKFLDTTIVLSVLHRHRWLCGTLWDLILKVNQRKEMIFDPGGLGVGLGCPQPVMTGDSENMFLQVLRVWTLTVSWAGVSTSKTCVCVLARYGSFTVHLKSPWWKQHWQRLEPIPADTGQETV